MNFFELANQVTTYYTFLGNAVNLENFKYTKCACKKEPYVYH